MRSHPLRLALLFVPLLSALGSAQSNKSDTVDLSFGVYTSDKATTMYRMFTPVLEDLQARLETRLRRPVDIQLRIYKTYEDALEAIIKGQIDFVRFGPASYVLAKAANPGIELLAVELNEGKKSFKGMIVVRRDSPVRTLADLRNRSFAFGDINSTIGRYLVQDLMMEAKIAAKDLSRFEYLGSHDRVFRAVEVGDFDAGSVKEDTFQKLNDKNQLRVIVTFDNVTKPWLARSGLPADVTAAMRAELLATTDVRSLAALKADGLAETSDRDFATTRDSMQRAAAFGVTPAAPRK
jgi:phosphonate transport system substrate-binding protein